MYLYYLSNNIVKDMYPYMPWDMLYYYTDASDDIWKYLCKLHRFTRFGSYVTYRTYFLYKILHPQVMRPSEIPSHLWQNLSFVRFFLNENQDGTILEYIPDSAKTKEIILQCIKLTPLALKFVNLNLLHEDIFLEIIGINQISNPCTKIFYLPVNKFPHLFQKSLSPCY